MYIFYLFTGIFLSTLFVCLVYFYHTDSRKIKEISIFKIQEKKTKKAAVFCSGPAVSPVYANYDAYPNCLAASSVLAGNRLCSWACLGYGSCVTACPIGAIELDKNHHPIISTICNGCGACVPACPRGIIQLIPQQADYFVACSSQDPPAIRKKTCLAPCTSCAVCSTVNMSGGYYLEHSTAIAQIDYRKTGDRQSAFLSCPESCIEKL